MQNPNTLFDFPQLASRLLVALGLNHLVMVVCRNRQTILLAQFHFRINELQRK